MTKQVVVVGPPIKKRLGEMGLSEMKLGEMLPNRFSCDGSNVEDVAES